MKLFSVKIIFFTNSQNVSPSSFPLYGSTILSHSTYMSVFEALYH